MQNPSRRKFLKLSGGVAAVAAALGVAYKSQRKPEPPPEDGWNAGRLAHLLPSANHRRFLIKLSFVEKPKEKPLLKVAGQLVEGQQTDSEGLFWRFLIENLKPDTEYQLQLLTLDDQVLCDPWPLRTFPAPEDHPETFRLLAYTCAGGPDHLYNFGFFNAYLPTELRQRLFARALSFKPDAVVANGDHVYWDLKSSKFMGRSWRAAQVAGLFDREQVVIGTSNEKVLHKAFGPQIAGLYGVRFRSVPMYFLQDDHDYGENDEADEDMRTFPPDEFMLDLARTTQRMYYPELFVDESMPDNHLIEKGISENFGRLRYGDLFEGLLYDCKRFMATSQDPDFSESASLIIPEEIEQWLQDHSQFSDVAHLAHMPSTPVLWSAGKWGEWYPDVLDDGVLGIKKKKPYWPNEWLKQHDRLLDTLVKITHRIPLFISGDLHATGTGRIVGNQEKDYSQNPVMSILTGSIGTGALGWASKMRGIKPTPSVVLQTEEWQEPMEENGFTIIDFDRNGVKVSHFKWTPEQGEDAIDSLEPFSVIRLPRPKSRV